MKLIADVWGCGDFCECWYPRIWTPRPSEYPDGRVLTWRDVLWEGHWRSEYDPSDISEAREEFAAACAEHGIPIDLSSDCIWDWEAELETSS